MGVCKRAPKQRVQDASNGELMEIRPNTCIELLDVDDDNRVMNRQ
jgi:hypothetical protein